MLELLPNPPDGFELAPGSQPTPIPIAEEVASLSAILLDAEAILLDADYQALLKTMGRTLNGVQGLDEAGLIPFKARAWIDLSRRHMEGKKVDDRDVKKHRNEVARLLQLLGSEATFDLPEKIKADIQAFIDAFLGHNDSTPKQFGVTMTSELVIDRLRHAAGSVGQECRRLQFAFLLTCGHGIPRGRCLKADKRLQLFRDQDLPFDNRLGCGRDLCRADRAPSARYPRWTYR